MAKLLDKFFNRIIEGDLLELSEKEKKLAQYAPVFNATLEEDLEHEKIDVVMERADRDDILSHKYPVICLKIPDKENEGEYNYMFFKADVYNEHSEGLQYCLWLGEIKESDNTKSISKLELSFVWDGDEAKVLFEEQVFPFRLHPVEIARFEVGSGLDDVSIFEVGNVYGCFIGSHQTSNAFYLMFCQSSYGNSVYFTSSNYVYNSAGDLVYNCLLSLTSSGNVQFSNDDGPITMDTEDEIVIYKL